MASPYLTKARAVSRLTDEEEGYGLTPEEAGAVTGGDLRLASDALDSMAPFEGERAQRDQEREFPRVMYVGDSRAGATVPDAVLDWVALKALELSAEHEPGVRSEGAGRVSVSYSEPKRSQLERRMDGLIEPYLLKTGSRA